MNEVKAPRFSSSELKVQDSVRRRANQQLLRTPWRRFRAAYEEYPRWQAMALWSEILLEMGARGESSVLATLNKCCPDFVAGRQRLGQSEPLALDLLEWAHTQRFGYAKQECWLDALIFYGVRHPLSRGAWAYWEICESESKRNGVAASVPSFDRWWRSAFQSPVCGEATCDAVAAAVESYLDWEAFTLWMRPFFFIRSGLPTRANSELKRRFPRASRLADFTPSQDRKKRASMWRRVASGGPDRLLSRARKQGFLGNLLEQVHSHPWHVRIRAYAESCEKEGDCSPTPSFRRWQEAAGSYIKRGGASRSFLVNPPIPFGRTF